MAKAGTDYPTGAMGGNINEAVAAEIHEEIAAKPAAPPPQAAPPAPRPMAPEPPAPSPFLETPEPEAPEPTPEPTPRASRGAPPAPKEVDFMALRAEQEALAAQAIQGSQMQRAMPLMQELRELPDPRQISPEDFDSLTPYQQFLLNQKLQRRREIERELQTGFQQDVQQKTLAARNQIDMIAQRWREVAHTYPEYAAQIIDIAKRMPADRQSDPDTYPAILDNIRGRELRERETKSNFSKAGAAASSSRASGSSAGRGEALTSQGLTILNKLGIRDKKWIDRTVERLAEPAGRRNR